MSGGFFDEDDMFESHFNSGFGGGLFSQLFSQGRSSRSRNSHKTKTSYLPFKLSLEDAFKGKKTKLLIKRKKICNKCSGSGSKSGTNSTCRQCRGRGIVTRVQRIGPGMVTQSQGMCDECNGQGEIIEDSDRCEDCGGNKVLPDSKTIEVTFPKGSSDGTCITLNGEGDQNPGQEPGDLVIKVELKPHSTFKCADGNLHMEKKVTMTEALCGVKFPVERLDGTVFLVRVNKLIKQGDVKVISNEGMPSSDRKRGMLVISFDVEYPSEFYASKSDILLLKSLLNGGSNKSNFVDQDAQKVEMTDFVQTTRCSGGTESDDDDDEGPRGRQHTTQCSSQ